MNKSGSLALCGKHMLSYVKGDTCVSLMCGRSIDINFTVYAMLSDQNAGNISMLKLALDC